MKWRDRFGLLFMFPCVTAQVPETFYKYKTEDVLELFFASLTAANVTVPFRAILSSRPGVKQHLGPYVPLPKLPRSALGEAA